MWQGHWGRCLWGLLELLRLGHFSCPQAAAVVMHRRWSLKSTGDYQNGCLQVSEYPWAFYPGIILGILSNWHSSVDEVEFTLRIMKGSLILFAFKYGILNSENLSFDISSSFTCAVFTALLLHSLHTLIKEHTGKASKVSGRLHWTLRRMETIKVHLTPRKIPFWL